MTHTFHPEAWHEYQEAVREYERARPGYGVKFDLEVRDAIQRVKAFPEGWSFLSKPYRKCNVRHFPYGVVYTVEGGKINIWAVMHLHR